MWQFLLGLALGAIGGFLLGHRLGTGFWFPELRNPLG